MEDKTRYRDVQVQQGILQDVSCLRAQVRELQYKLYDEDVLEQQEKVEELRDELHQTNKEGDYDRTAELRAELEDTRDKMAKLKKEEEAQDDSDQDSHTYTKGRAVLSVTRL